MPRRRVKVTRTEAAEPLRGMLYANNGYHFAIVGDPLEDDDKHRVHFGFVRTDGTGTEDEDHVLTAERGRGVPI